MVRKSIKYLIIVGINLLILTGLLAYWTDEIELSFNNWVRPIEFLKVIGFTLLSLIGIRIGIIFFRKKNFPTRKRIMISVLLTVFISSFLYFNYSKKVYENRILNRELRNNLSDKIKSVNGFAFGTKADNLTFKEYQELAKVNWFPKLQKEADSISYYYAYDGFMPDYSFRLSYSIPKTTNIDTSEFKFGEIKVDTLGNRKVIVYNEYVD